MDRATSPLPCGPKLWSRVTPSDHNGSDDNPSESGGNPLALPCTLTYSVCWINSVRFLGLGSRFNAKDLVQRFDFDMVRPGYLPQRLRLIPDCRDRPLDLDHLACEVLSNIVNSDAFASRSDVRREMNREFIW